MGLLQLQLPQVQRALPQAVDLQVGVQAGKGQLLGAGCAEAQVVQGQFEAERIEFDVLEAGRYGGVFGQLLVGQLEACPRQQIETEQGIQQRNDYQSGEAAFQSFGHGKPLRSMREVSWSMACPAGSECGGLRQFDRGERDWGMACRCGREISRPHRDQRCRIRVLSGWRPSLEGKSAAGGSTSTSRTGRPLLLAQRSTWSRHSSSSTLARLLQHTSVPPSAVASRAGLSRLW
ncbi:hypothetical protein D3C80_1398170 [compost metagenome]